MARGDGAAAIAGFAGAGGASAGCVGGVAAGVLAMAEYHPCPYFDGDFVEITDERYRHVVSNHDDFALGYWEKAGETIQDPDLVIRRKRDNGAVMLYRWYDDLDKNVVVVVRSDLNGRNWLVTAYMTRKSAQGELLWAKS